MSILNLMTKVDDLKSVLDKKTDEIAKEFAKEVLTNNLEFKDIQNVFKDIPTETAILIMMKSLSIISKSTTTASVPQQQSHRSNRGLFS